MNCNTKKPSRFGKRLAVFSTLIALAQLNLVFAGGETQTRELLDQVVLGNAEAQLEPLKPSEMRALKKLLDAQKNVNQKASDDPEFDAALKAVMQLTPEQIKKMNQLMDEIEQAKYQPPNGKRGVTRSNMVDLSPGSEVPKAYLAVNNTSSLVFLDATGQPWPVVAFDNPNDTIFNVTQPKTQQHVLSISPKQSYAYGNINVTLDSLNVPVVVQLVVGYGEIVDLRHEYHIAAEGPNATHSIGRSPKIADDVMLSILDGVPPGDLKRMKTNDKDAQVWEQDGLYFIRTKAYLLLPAPLSRESSSDGTHVYKAPKLPSLSVSLNGQYKQIRVYE